MTPELYFAEMLITNSQKARRIFLAKELEDWFMDLFDEEYEDILNGSFQANQEIYINNIVEKYLEMTNVGMTNTDEYSKSVIDKAFKTASEIQDVTWKNIVSTPIRNIDEINVMNWGNKPKKNEKSADEFLLGYIIGGIAVSPLMVASDRIKQWLGQTRANLIALNEANWKWNNEEYFDALDNKKTKTWHTALDERVRIDHIAVEGVTIPIKDYFMVGGYPMRYALDYLAPISQTANCRCSVEYK